MAHVGYVPLNNLGTLKGTLSKGPWSGASRDDGVLMGLLGHIRTTRAI